MMENSADDGCNSSQSKKRKIDEKITIINDPIWGPIELHPLCIKIIDTPQFQRLRHIKQLGGCSFVYPGACHSRFEHSIGTSHLARMMGEELQKKHSDKIITNEEILCLEVAGLCHDLGHGPFSHVFDQQFQAKCNHSWTHEDLSIEMVDEIFKSIKLSKEEENDLGKDGEKYIKAFIKPPKDPKDRPIQKPFLYEIIANEENKIDVDKWDYFSRDCHMMGLHHNFQCKRSIKLARIVEDHISFPKSEYFNLFDMFYTRFTLHRRAYKHPVVKAVEMMIADAFFKADNNLTFPSGCQSLSKSTENMDAYQWVTDDVLQQIRRIELDLIEENYGNVKDSQHIIDRIYRRDLYKLIGEKRVKWVKESVKNIAEKLTTLVNSLARSKTETATLKNTIDKKGKIK
ncbi:deoxynucleoside triphosphate triphosphohydrolase SAMHD1-like [Magallana gigas]|uniref:deoxynucleoside triphosphate triphosphohydrolase SAMHD1-like n=1 Tax=Magallana gigas TaxID=29159 RepID=UPI003341C607